MGEAKVGTLREIMLWGAIDATDADDNNWSGVRRAGARRRGERRSRSCRSSGGRRSWVAKLDNQNCNSTSKCFPYAPKSAAALAEWQRFVGEAVERYGRGGTFWQENPGVPELPVETWQFWNEENSKTFFAPKPKAKGYAKMLSAAADATIQRRDPSAQVALGGMAELAGSRKAIRGSEYLEDLYDVSGIKSDFDGIAPHPYGATIGKVAEQVEEYRKIMKRAGDSSGAMYVTEVGAGSASGGNSLNRGSDGPGRAADRDLQVLPEEAQLVQRRDRQLVQLAGRHREHLLVVQDLRPAEGKRQGEAFLQGVREADRRQEALV